MVLEKKKLLIKLLKIYDSIFIIEETAAKLKDNEIVKNVKDGVNR